MLSKTFCILPWKSICVNTHGTVRACGWSVPGSDAESLKRVTLDAAWNGDYFKNLRNDMLNGNENANCARCYTKERLAGFSKRTETNLRFGNNEISKIADITANDYSVTVPPSRIDVRVGNICNLKCVHCWTGNSSRWHEDKLLLDKYENTSSHKIDNSWITSDDKVWKYIRDNIKDITHLNILGGEPFASKQHMKLIDWLINTGNTHITLEYISNGIFITDTVVKKLQKFKAVQLGISLDDINDRGEFIRFPTVWGEFVKNISFINDNLPNAFFIWSGMNLNIYNVDETYQFCVTNFKNMKFSYGCFVESPKHMSLQNLPDQLKAIITEKVKYVPGIDFYLKYMNNGSLWESHCDVLKNYLNDLDTTRYTKWREIFPELSYYIK